MKVFANNKLIVDDMTVAFDGVENILRKGENTGSPFSTMFSRGFFPRAIKFGIV